MSPLDQTRSRVRALLQEIERLKDSEFPYEDSREALLQLRELYRKKLALLEGFSAESNPQTIVSTCRATANQLFNHLPILGFILRSTNVRNSFDAFGPLKRLAVELLEPDREFENAETRLLLSSEWQYSPFTHYAIPELPNFILIGLPAPESSNPLLLPLTGHELGHVVWKRHVEEKFKQRSFELTHEQVLNEPARSAQEFHISEEDLKDASSLAAAASWWAVHELATRQLGEIFCDIVGLRLFDISYVKAFVFLLSPAFGRRRLDYPTLTARLENLRRAASVFSISVPPTLNMFEDLKSSSLSKSHAYRVEIADAVVEKMIHELIASVDEYISRTSIVPSSDTEIKRIKMRLEQCVPATNCKNVSDILNATWLACEDLPTWESGTRSDNKAHETLMELCLKNLEIFEIEKLLG